jgi:hypothetical protein
MLLLATSEQRTMTGLEETQFRDHVGTCETCQTLTTEHDENYWRWLVRVPADAVEGTELLALPMVDPIVFHAKHEIASGGMGRITRAFDRRLGREVAIKEVLEHDLRDRFEREVRITARLQHPAIVPIYEAGTFPDGSSFYTMRLVPGRTLQDAIGDAKSLEERLRLMPHVRACADALAYAHARGVIHRDLKPSNVLVGEFGETVVIDWGLAKETGDLDDDLPAKPRIATLTRTGSVIGTPCFMSPAQAAGRPVDATDDVYALGAILYNVLSGSPPYWDSVAHEADALIAATLEHAPTPIASRAPEAPEDLHAIIEHAMARDPAARYPTAKELTGELARFEAGQLLVSRAYSSRELFVRWLRRHKLGVSLAALAFVAAIVVGVLLLRVKHAADELAIRARGAQLTAFYGEAARQAYVIDRDLLRLENALEGLAAAAAWALEGPEPTGEVTIYFDRDFANNKRPDDYTKKTAYRWDVSVEYPVVGVAPGTAREEVMPKIRKLAPLRHHFREMVLEAAVRGDTRGLSREAANELLLSRAGPIDYAYVDLPEGVHVVWPGMAGLRADYDVRTASFYQMSVNKRGRNWGLPYVDSTTNRDGDDLVLPCTKGVWSRAGEFLGVAGVEMTVTKLVSTSMRMQTREPLRVSIVDKTGRKVVDSGDAGKLFPSSGKDEAIEFVPFDLADVAEAVGNNREGIVETTRGGEPIVVAIVRLDAVDSVDWYYVVEVAASTLGAKP